jgi:alkanesulfonate monooxygenase SsuD/methylene tetrahydromethanopterin reductase-like flavin-dependent oxidoreductase (luciferase family)
MDVGVYVDAHLGIGEHARRLEQAGFSHLWIYDSPLVFGEPYMAALEAARATERIVIGPGVTHPGSRPAPATAQALATLAKAAPGRVVFGVGIGSSARHSLGMRPATLDQLHDYVRVVRTMLAGGEAEYREGDRTHPVAFIHPQGRWVDVDHQVQTWISAFGPKGQQRAGRQADGVMVRWEGEEPLERARDQVRAGAREAGRDPDAVRLGVLYAVYPVSDADELDGEEARAALGPLVVSRLRYLTANYSSADEVPPMFRDGFLAYREYREGLDAYRRHLDNYQGYLTLTPEHLERFVTPLSMRTVCHVADSDGVAAELQRMADAGAAHASLQIAGPPAAWCDRMGREVLPKLR